MKKKKENYLDFVPICNPLHTWEVNEKQLVVVHIVHQGIYHKIAQKFFKRPKISHISLDVYGSFVWQQMDGRKTIFEIANAVKEQFGEDAEPVIQRVVRFFQILYQNKFIGYVKQKKR